MTASMTKQYPPDDKPVSTWWLTCWLSRPPSGWQWQKTTSHILPVCGEVLCQCKLYHRLWLAGVGTSEHWPMQGFCWTHDVCRCEPVAEAGSDHSRHRLSTVSYPTPGGVVGGGGQVTMLNLVLSVCLNFIDDLSFIFNLCCWQL